jgi:hypothetical protein
MIPRFSVLTRFEAAYLAIVAFILIVTLLVPPIVGLADNGDFYKMMSKFGLEHSAQSRGDRYFAFVDSVYVPDPAGAARYQQVWGKTLISSEIIFMAAAVRLNSLFGFDREFHLQFLGIVHIAVLLLGAWLLLLGTRGMSKPKRILGAILSLIMFLDVGYTGYFNSAFTETSSFLFLILLIAAAVPVILRKPFAPACILFYFLFSFLFCSSRYPNALMFPLLALFGFILAIQSRKIISGILALAAAVAGSFLLLGYIRCAPPSYNEFSLYNHFFNALLPFSPAPDQDLKEFGMDPSLQKYSKTTYYQPESAVYNNEAIRQFRASVSMNTIMKFYLRHPKRAVDAVFRSVARGMALHPGYGNYEKKAGKPPGSRSQGFVVWSTIRESLLPKSFWIVAIVLIVAMISALRPWKTLCTAGFRILMVFLCALQLVMISCASEPSDIIRHMFLFNLLFDVVLLITGIEVLFYLGERLTRSEVDEEAYSD